MKYVFLHEEIDFFIYLIKEELGDFYFVDKLHINIISINPIKLKYKTDKIECHYANYESYYFHLKFL